MSAKGNGNGKECTISRDEELAYLRQAMEGNPLLQGRNDPSLESIRELFPGYHISRLVGRGGQGAVYEAWKDGETQMLAIKVMRDWPIASRRQEKRFRREIRLLQRLNHPGIVKVHDSGTIKGKPYLVMPFVLGCPINEHAIADGLNLRERIELFLQTCAAVSAAHAKRIVHRDLKPANILVHCMIDEEDSTEENYIRLLDFGLAKDLSEEPGDYTPSSDVSLTGQGVGTARYSSPEQISGASVGVQSDIYSLGVVLFELLSDELPYVPTPAMRSYIDLITRGDRRSLREAIRQHIRDTDYPLFPYRPKDVRRDLETVRYATVDEFADDLRRYIAGEPVKAHIGVGQRIRSVKRAYRRKLAAAAVIALVATSGTVAAFAWRGKQEMARTSQSALFLAGFVRQASDHFDNRKPDKAIETLQQAVEVLSLVPATDPLVCRQAYQAYYNLAEYHFKTDHPDEASLYCEKAIKLSDALQRSDPSDLLFMRLGSYSHRLSGLVAYAQGNWGKAIQDFENMLTVRELLADREPGVAHRAQEIADAHTNIGKAARRDGQLDKALKHDTAACSIFANLMHANPRKFDYVIRLSNAELRLSIGHMLHRTRDHDSTAIEILARARNRLTELTVESPGLKNRIIDELGTIDKNVDILKRRAAPSGKNGGEIFQKS